MLDIARHFYQSSCLDETGTFEIKAQDSVFLVRLCYGYVCGINSSLFQYLTDVKMEVQIEWDRLLRMDAPVLFHKESLLGQITPIFPFHPAPLIRRYVDSVAKPRAPSFYPSSSTWVHLVLPPHVSCLKEEETWIVQFLSEPRTFSELLQHSFLPRSELVQFLVFLEQVGALSFLESAPFLLQEELRLLGLTLPLTIEKIKTAYRQSIRKYHPDAHPESTDEEYHALGEKLIHIQAAYHRLMAEVKQSS